MSEWSMEDLYEWDKKICAIAKEAGLDWYEIAYETCDYFEMIGNMAYHGMPSHFSHWSYGKSFERTHFMYNAGQEGLPYELIINSNPSIAYLMVENPLYLQVLIMAHCVGHSDFFKNNRTFKDTDADMITSKFRSARSRIQRYIEDPSIGIEKVEKLIDACHSIQYQIDRRGRFRRSERELVDSFIQSEQNTSKKKDLESIKFPIEPEYDVLLFLLENCNGLAPWQ